MSNLIPIFKVPKGCGEVLSDGHWAVRHQVEGLVREERYCTGGHNRVDKCGYFSGVVSLFCYRCGQREGWKW